jgi:predicted glycogen debranching enzyme
MALYSLETAGQLEPFLHQEWLLTNGIGGFAASTVVACNTRRYHGLLIAATNPPVGRIMTLNRLGEILLFDDAPGTLHELSIARFEKGFHPRGERYLRRFELDDTARWHYVVEDVRITKELLLVCRHNVAAVRYAVDAPPGRGLELRLLPFISLRDFHTTPRHSAGSDMPYTAGERALSVTNAPHTLHIQADAGRFIEQSRWWFGQIYAIETERGLDDTEDLFNPGYFSLRGSGTITLWCGLQIPSLDWDAEIARRRSTIAAVTMCDSTPVVQKLSRAANDFVVDRKTPTGADGTSVIAGYPWFADWGRDTMICVPGLLLATRRFEQARQVLSVFAQYVSQGMIPNRFDDYTSEPQYNTVDASLWFVHACFEYLKHSNDRNTFDRMLLPACRQIFEGYRRGTRFHIKMDEADGLISQGDPGTQLTWMDAKCDGVVFTPRQGKPVEINALLYHALMLLVETALADKVAASFSSAFWISPFRGLADVIRPSPQQRDTSIRPNQIFAVSLEHSPLTHDQQLAVVEVVRRELLTPFGLRTLAKSDPNYKGRFTGPPRQRDAAYHNGTVWPWLIGPFLEAYLRVNGESAEAREQAKKWLTPLLEQLEGPCLGQLAEVYEADEPHRAAGCFAQAWSVAETLRMAVRLGM